MMRTYKVGVIGCGVIGGHHASGLIGLPNATLAAACDVIPGTLNAFKERWNDSWPNISMYTDHREMLKNEDLDIITVATSDHLHADLVVNAANAGVKGIFCEKPLATNLADADRMIEAVERNNTTLSIDHTRRWMPLWRYTKEEVVGKNMIGRVQCILGFLTGGRAMLFRNGTHIIDMICYFAESDPEWVSAELETGYEDYWEYRGDGGHDPATEPAAHGYIHFANGVRGFYVGGPKTTRRMLRLEIIGTKGFIFIEDAFTEPRVQIRTSDKYEDIQIPTWDVVGIPAGVQELVRIVDEGGEPVSPGRAGREVVEIILGFLDSNRRDYVKVQLPLPRD